MKRRILIAALLLAVLAGGYFAWRAEQPIAAFPSATWASEFSDPGFTSEPLRVAVDGAELEVLLLKPVGHDAPLPAAVFAGGSSDWIFQNYAPGFLETYARDHLVARGVAVALVNKRGMGASTGNWMNNTLQGRATDVQAVAQALRADPSIDPDRVGYLGHSQGGWVVIWAGAEDGATGFVINLMGPLRPTSAQFEYQWQVHYACTGRSEAEAARAFNWKSRITNIAVRLGRFVPIGMLQFDAAFFRYDTSGLLENLTAPTLAIYGTHDPLVDGAGNEAFLAAEFPAGIPGHLTALTIEGTNHYGALTPGLCEGFFGIRPGTLSPQLIEAFDAWVDANVLARGSEN